MIYNKSEIISGIMKWFLLSKEILCILKIVDPLQSLWQYKQKIKWRNIMKEFSIEINETLSRVVKVKAENLQQAIDIVTKQYGNEDIVLDSSDFMGYEINPYE